MNKIMRNVDFKFRLFCEFSTLTKEQNHYYTKYLYNQH